MFLHTKDIESGV